MNRLITPIIFVILFALLSACAANQPATAQPEPTQAVPTQVAPDPTAAPAKIEVTDSQGNTVVLEKPAERIISLAPSNTEIVFALGAGAQMVGRDTFSDFPAEALDVKDIGGGFAALDMESIVALSPDLVLAADITAPEQIQALADLGVLVVTIPNPIQIEDIFPNLLLVGKLTGRDSQAQALVASLTERLNAVDQKIASVSERPIVFYEIDGTDPKAPWTIGPGSFGDALILRAGGENAAKSLESPWGQLSLEQLLVVNPDIILLGTFTWGGVTPDQVAARAGWDGLAAVQAGKVFSFDDNLVSRPGPRIVDGLEEMAKFFHPDLFK